MTGGWRSTTVAAGYLEKSETNKRHITNQTIGKENYDLLPIRIKFDVGLTTLDHRHLQNSTIHCSTEISYSLCCGISFSSLYNCTVNVIASNSCNNCSNSFP